MIKIKYFLYLLFLFEQNNSFNLVSQDRWSIFHNKVQNTILNHQIVTNNQFTKNFAKGKVSYNKQRVFVQQFSVFSQLFLIAQLQKVINAHTIEDMRNGKEILCNELGVEFNNEGSIQKGSYRHSSAHFEWLVNSAKPLGFTYNDLGKKRLGSQYTLFFCDKLSELYGSEDDITAIAASYAIENWAQAGFWDELIEGFEKINIKRRSNNQTPIPLSFWKFHSKLEKYHAAHTVEELKSVYFENRITDEDKFLNICEEMLDAINTFWKGIDIVDIVL